MATLVEQYIVYTRDHKHEYGERTVVLLHCGSFYEIYGCGTSDGGISGSIVDAAETCSLRITKKTQKTTVRGNALQIIMPETGHDSVAFDWYMAGFQLPYLEKYVAMLVQDGWTVPVYQQIGTSKEDDIHRKLLQVFTPGTTFLEDDVAVSNTIACIWMTHLPPSLINPTPRSIHGCASLDIYTGGSRVAEYIIDPSTGALSDYDNAAHYIAVENPTEIRIITDDDAGTDVEQLRRALGPTRASVRVVQLSDAVTNCSKQLVREAAFEEYFPHAAAPDSCVLSGVRERETGASAFVYLLTSLSRQCPELVSKLKDPVVHAAADKLSLANHSLQQLNIVTPSGGIGRGTQSVLQMFTGRASTMMGRRRMSRALLHPLTNPEVLESCYKSIELALGADDDDVISACRSKLRGITDLEKMYRMIVIGRAGISTISDLYASLEAVQELLDWVCGSALAPAVHNSNIASDGTGLAVSLQTLRDFITHQFRVEDMDGKTFRDRIFQEDVCPLLHQSADICDNKSRTIEMLAKKIPVGVAKWGKGRDGAPASLEIHPGIGGGSGFFQTTKKRATALCASPATFTFSDVRPGSEEETESVVYNLIRINHNTITHVARGSGEKRRLRHSALDALFSSRQDIYDTIEARNNDLFAEVVLRLIAFSAHFDTVSTFVGELDMLMTKAHIAREHAFCRPTIPSLRSVGSAGESRDSSLSIVGLRHPLIERAQTKELYVPNDIRLEQDQRGMLLFGTNAVGKSSLVKSVGIAVVLAQAGMYVPASEMVYYPFTQLFTRILGNDDLFRGLSTFAVEMIELNTIIRQADSRSLVLGDEICSGTETTSAVAIFSAGLEHLSSVNAAFMFATHLHEVARMKDELDIPGVVFRHLAVHYDADSDTLEYIRTLRDGPGDAIYGLEVCRALHMPSAFTERAGRIRQRLLNQGIAAPEGTKSRYNAKKIVGACELCGEKSTETHHLQHQKGAVDGRVKGGMTHHAANLMALCESCHSKLHKEGGEHQRRRVGGRFQLVASENA
jgi:DNA mismatch repair protein MutS